MIRWKRENIFRLLCLFGDDKLHPWMEVINLGTRLFLDVKIEHGQYKTHQAKFEAFLQKSIEYGLVDMLPTEYIIKERNKKAYQISKHDYNYKLSAKGDRILRQEQAAREDNPYYYNLFDRSVDGKFGVDTFAPLTPTSLGVKDKQTYKAKNLRKEK